MHCVASASHAWQGLQMERLKCKGPCIYLQLLRGEREGNQSTATGGHIAGCQGFTPQGVPVRLGF